VDPSGQILYAVNELDTFENQPTGTVSVFAINRETGALKLLQQVSSLGLPAHLSWTSRPVSDGGELQRGNVAVFPSERMGDWDALSVRAGDWVKRESAASSGPHAHSIQVTQTTDLPSLRISDSTSCSSTGSTQHGL